MLNFARRMATISPAKIVSQQSHIVPGKLKITEHFFDVPKDYSKPDAGTIRIFARSARKHETPIVPEDCKEKQQIPWMVYLQGGPGMECRSPQAYPWTDTILDKGYQMLFLDQRGTGLSTPVTASTLQMRGGTDVQAKYLKLYRADSIVKDCEAIRLALTADYPDNKKKWSTTSQSFGGFCSISYLSYHPEGLREVFLFGGLQPLVTSPDPVYDRLYKRVISRNAAYYEKYPTDIPKVKKIMSYLARFGDGKIKLPSEGTLTRRRFQMLGLYFGAHGGFDAVHDIVLKANYDIEAFGHLTRGTLSAIDRAQSFDDNMLYALLHEPIYCSGEGKASQWSAERIRAQYPEFDVDNPATTPPDAAEDQESKPIYFTGEMIYPWMFEDFTELRKVQPVAELVAKDSSWGPLFDKEQLAKNTVPVYAAAYVEDMYVDFDYSMETAKAIKGCKVFTTNVMFHNAVSARTAEVVKQAFQLRDDVLD